MAFLCDLWEFGAVLAERTSTEKSVFDQSIASNRPQINIKTATSGGQLPERSCLSSKSRGSASMFTSAQEKKKTRFEDDKEEAKYKVYLKHVTMLNQMKTYLAEMHDSMGKDVV